MFKLSFHRFSLSLSCCASIVLAACGGGGGAAADAQTLPAAQAAAPAPTTVVSAATTVNPIPEAVAAPVAAEPAPFGQDAGGYKLTFNEEFDIFNSGIWNDHIWYQGSNATKNYTVENGSLKIWPQRDANGNFFDRTIDTDGKYTQTYGYFEMEAKLPVGKGTWPAFWLFNHIGERRPEMDIMEAYAGGNGWGNTDAQGIAHPTAFAPTIWIGDYEGHQAGTKMTQVGIDLSADFHKYAVKWEPNKQTYYFDGKEIYSVNVAMTDPMYIMLDLWFGSASGTPDDSTPQGKNNAYEVKYVRAWQFK
ncbi:glycoside hydrolase family 16 protein [Oxalobacteraceae bacterium OM1]|nr:glycoside hydrolase family 16 protein [Oxalobacteraceae bacterium OM1]